MPTTQIKITRGYTCADCKFCRRCVTLFAGKESSTVCHYTPSRFALSLTKVSEFTQTKTDRQNERTSY